MKWIEKIYILATLTLLPRPRVATLSRNWKVVSGYATNDLLDTTYHLPLTMYYFTTYHLPLTDLPLASYQTTTFHFRLATYLTTYDLDHPSPPSYFVHLAEKEWDLYSVLQNGGRR